MRLDEDGKAAATKDRHVGAAGTRPERHKWVGRPAQATAWAGRPKLRLPDSLGGGRYVAPKVCSLAATSV